MINYKKFYIKQSLLSHYFRVYGPDDYLYPNTFDTVKDAKKFIDIINGDYENEKI